VSFADRLRAWFKGESKRSAPSPSTDKASRSSTRELSEFVDSRRGVEAYLEPKTALYSTTVLLIADDGEYLRRPISDPKQAASFCEKHDIPLYDARKVGYPRRMRDYERGKPQRGIGLDELPPWPGEEPQNTSGDRPDHGGDADAGGDLDADVDVEPGPPAPPTRRPDRDVTGEDDVDDGEPPAGPTGR
jgi:hypothetical protein